MRVRASTPEEVVLAELILGAMLRYVSETSGFARIIGRFLRRAVHRMS